MQPYITIPFVRQGVQVEISLFLQCRFRLPARIFYGRDHPHLPVSVMQTVDVNKWNNTASERASLGDIDA